MGKDVGGEGEGEEKRPWESTEIDPLFVKVGALHPSASSHPQLLQLEGRKVIINNEVPIMGII